MAYDQFVQCALCNWDKRLQNLLCVEGVKLVVRTRCVRLRNCEDTAVIHQEIILIFSLSLPPLFPLCPSVSPSFLPPSLPSRFWLASVLFTSLWLSSPGCHLPSLDSLETSSHSSSVGSSTGETSERRGISCHGNGCIALCDRMSCMYQYCVPCH